MANVRCAPSGRRIRQALFRNANFENVLTEPRICKVRFQLADQDLERGPRLLPTGNRRVGVIKHLVRTRLEPHEQGAVLVELS